MDSDKKLEAQFSGLTLAEEPLAKFKPVKVAKNPDLVKNFLRLATGDESWSQANYKVASEVFELDKNSSVYKTVKAAFDKTNNVGYVVKIDRVNNPFPYAQYLLKKTHKKSLVESTKAVELFHGTKEEYVRSICNINLDWRLAGSSRFKGNKYGNGVSFSPSASYASKFPRGARVYPRVMFLCDVLVHKKTIGGPESVVPPTGADATGSKDGMVVVKYDDNEFDPKYVIYYKKHHGHADDDYSWYDDFMLDVQNDDAYDDYGYDDHYDDYDYDLYDY